MGFGRMFAEGQNRKMVRKWLHIGPKMLKIYRIVEQDMADQIFGVPGPGGGPKKAQNGRFWVPGKSYFWPLFGEPIIMSTGSPWGRVRFRKGLGDGQGEG